MNPKTDTHCQKIESLQLYSMYNKDAGTRFWIMVLLRGYLGVLFF